MTDRGRRLRLVALGVVLAAGDALLLGLSGVRLFANRRSPLRRRFRDWYIEADGSFAGTWKALQAFLVAAILLALWRRTKEHWPLPWAGLFLNLGLAIRTRYHEDIGTRLVDITGRSEAERWGEIWMTLTTGGLIVLAVALVPKARTTWQLAAITVTLLGSAVLLDLAGDGAKRDASGRSRSTWRGWSSSPCWDSPCSWLRISISRGTTGPPCRRSQNRRDA